MSVCLSVCLSGFILMSVCVYIYMRVRSRKSSAQRFLGLAAGTENNDNTISQLHLCDAEAKKLF